MFVSTPLLRANCRNSLSAFIHPSPSLFKSSNPSFFSQSSIPPQMDLPRLFHLFWRSIIEQAGIVVCGGWNWEFRINFCEILLWDESEFCFEYQGTLSFKHCTSSSQRLGTNWRFTVDIYLYWAQEPEIFICFVESIYIYFHEIRTTFGNGCYLLNW